MTDAVGTLKRSLVFLERELDRLGDAADDAEHELRLKPTDVEACRRVEAVYVLAREVWTKIQALRVQEGESPGIQLDRASRFHLAYKSALG